MKQKMLRLYDVSYKDGKSGPSEIIISLDNFERGPEISVGPFHLNNKAYKVIKEATGLELNSCKVDTFYLD
jgi:hypothetical protein